MSAFTQITAAIEAVLNPLKVATNDEGVLLSNIAEMKSLAAFLQEETTKIRDHANSETQQWQERIEAEKRRIEAEYQEQMKKTQAKLEKLNGKSTKEVKFDVKPKTILEKVEKTEKTEKTEKAKISYSQIAAQLLTPVKSWADEEPEEDDGFAYQNSKKKEVVTKKFTNKPIPKSDQVVPVFILEKETDAYKHLGIWCWANDTQMFVQAGQLGETKYITRGIASDFNAPGTPYKIITHRPVANYPNPENSPFYIPNSGDVRQVPFRISYKSATESGPTTAGTLRFGSISKFKEDIAVVDDNDLELFNDIAAHFTMMSAMAKVYKK